MLLAAIGDDAYDVVLIVHLLAVIVAFGTLFGMPALRRSSPEVATRLYLRWALPATVVIWVAGMGLVGMSDKVFEMTQTWIVASLVVWLVLLALGVFVMRPALAQGEAGSSRVGMATGISHLLLVVALYLMVFKPGL
ncbi:MAG: hypothetical protein GEV08_14615 [Acidimicrobiia bacterium]|nr:hypothetical protein [Acidimicrobiia bacterium]